MSNNEHGATYCLCFRRMFFKIKTICKRERERENGEATVSFFSYLNSVQSQVQPNFGSVSGCLLVLMRIIPKVNFLTFLTGTGDAKWTITSTMYNYG